MSKPWTVLASFLLATAAAVSSAAQQAPSATETLPSEVCSGCFAYLEFPPLSEVEARRSRGYEHQVTPAPTKAGPETLIAQKAVAPAAPSKQ
jgi:hypothetical protein